MFPRQNQVQTKKKEEEENKTGSSADFVNTILSTGNENAGKLLLGEAEKSLFLLNLRKLRTK